MQLRRSKSRFDVVFDDAEVTLVELDFRLTAVIVDSDERTLRIVIAAPAKVREGEKDAAYEVEPASRSPAVGALAVALRWRKIQTCKGTTDGRLDAQFDGGLHLTVPASTRVEAWELGADDFKIISTPGGELAIWDHESPKATIRLPPGSSAES